YAPRLAVAPDLELDLAAGLLVCDQTRYLRGRVDLLAIDTENHVAGFQSGLVSGCALFDHADERAARTIQAEGFGELRVDFLNRNADSAARDLARLDE